MANSPSPAVPTDARGILDGVKLHYDSAVTIDTLEARIQSALTAARKDAFEAGQSSVVQGYEAGKRMVADTAARPQWQEQGWQPIETVPSVGPVLVCVNDLIWISRHPLMTKAQGKPTHWMPLPTPPSEAQR